MASVCSALLGDTKKRRLLDFLAVVPTSPDEPVFERAALSGERRVELLFEFRVDVDHDPS
jgi:hypothetical protein